MNFASTEGIDKALFSIAAMRPDGLITVPHTYTNHNMVMIAKFALEQRLPSLYPRKRYVVAGGLMSYDTNRKKNVAPGRGLCRQDPQRGQSGDSAGRAQLELVVNLMTAKKIGVTIHPEISLEASEVIK